MTAAEQQAKANNRKELFGCADIEEMFAFGDKAASIGEEKTSRRRYRCCHFLWAQEAIDPESTLGFACTITTMLLVLYSAFLIPARMGFDSEKDAGPMSKAIDLFAEFWFVWDIVINFHLGYEDTDTGQMVLDLLQIRAVYFKSWFLCDAVSSVPFQTLSEIMPSLKSLKPIKVLRLLKLFRLVKLLRLKVLEDLEDSGHLSPTTIRLSKITFTFVFLVHIVACTYWFVATQTCVLCDDENNQAGDAANSHWLDCSDSHSSVGRPTFGSPEFCPAVYKMMRPDSSEAMSDAVPGYVSPLTDKYTFGFYWAIMAMLGESRFQVSKWNN
jgi:hypothetical protein